MISFVSSLTALVLVPQVYATPRFVERADPCAAIAGQEWVAPAAVRACLRSFPVNETLRDNILDVSGRTANFHPSVNYELLAPEPFTASVHENLIADLARIQIQHYNSDFDMHVDLSNSWKRLRDGHAAYINMCYDSLYLTFVPIPLVNLNGDIHIAPEAFQVASAEFSDEIAFWQNELPLSLEQLSGAKVLTINGQDPWAAVDANSQVAGSFQAKSTRDNGFFASYTLASTGWTYRMGDFAQLSLPLQDQVSLTVQLTGGNRIVSFTLSYRSQFGSASLNFTDSASLWANNCRAVLGTNGVDLNETSTTDTVVPAPLIAPSTLNPATPGRFQPPVNPADARRPISQFLNDGPQFDIALPGPLTPTNPTSGSGAMQFFMLNDGKTGVLALGSFSGTFSTLESGLLSGLQGLKSQGATQLVVDVTNNGGGFICIAHWLHRIIAGPSAKSVPQAGLDTQARAQDLAQAIVKNIITQQLDPEQELLYNPLNWRFANNTPFPAEFDWLDPAVNVIINGRKDRFSVRIGNECQPFDMDPPDVALFDTKKVVIVNNGRCASSCALFTTAMNKHYGVLMAVVGGQPGVQQQYAGTVGGQSTDFSTIQTEAKTAKLQNHPEFPPDFLTNSVQGIAWRLGFGIFDPTRPEEWQSRPAQINFQQGFDTVNNPVEIWESIVRQAF